MTQSLKGEDQGKVLVKFLRLLTSPKLPCKIYDSKVPNDHRLVVPARHAYSHCDSVGSLYTSAPSLWNLIIASLAQDSFSYSSSKSGRTNPSKSSNFVPTTSSSTSGMEVMKIAISFPGTTKMKLPPCPHAVNACQRGRIHQ